MDAEAAQSSVGETRQPDQSQQSDAIENQQGDNLPDENEVEEYEEDEIDTSLLVGSSSQQEVATSSIDPGDSGADGVDQEEMIVISSDEDGADDDNSDQEFEDQADDDVINEEVDVENDEENENDTVSAISISDVSSVAQTNFPSSNLPFLVIQPTESARQRLPSRPGPLTPGIVMPSMTEDGDGIVPCTPTLVTHRHDEGYHAISSPRVPHGAGGQPIRFRFEDISSGNLFENLPGGVGSVDNTLMDLAAAGEDNSRSVPTTPVPQSTVFSQPSMSSVETSDLLPSTSGNAAVSSSIQEEEIDVENDELVPTTATSVERSETREASSIPTNTIRGRRRFRIIGAPRTRGRGANSPSTSNQP
uniref:Uncharacterized protein n=1 Tax=Ciona savignyi TaxID=51511 RepID=H2YYF1_CIOSA